MLLVFGFVSEACTFMLGSRFPALRTWTRSPFGYFSSDLLHYAIGLLTAAYFARTETLPAFFRRFGFDRKSSDRVWFGIVAALFIRGFGYLILTNHWSKGVFTYGLTAFKNTSGSERYWFLAPVVLLAPLFEEAIYRGFLYRAFRNSYPVWASTP